MLSNGELCQIILASERALQACETWRPSGPSQPEWLMWLPAEKFFTSSSDRQSKMQSLRLKPVQSDADWQKMRHLRSKIEQAFGLSDPKIIGQLVEDIQRKQEALNGQWYLAFTDTSAPHAVGEIGWFPVTSPLGTLGRIQDVDILPEYQGKGLGQALMTALCREAQKAQLQGLLLMALKTDWPWRWYEKLGFRVVGSTPPVSLA